MPPDLVPLLMLAGVVVLATAVQTAIGFGAMVVCVTLGALFWPVLELPPLLVPLTLSQTAFIAIRHRHAVVWRLLYGRILPIMGAGMAVGLAGVGMVDSRWVEGGLGAMVLLLALRELWRAWNVAPAKPPPRALSLLALVAAGVVHGLTVTGGPLLVWAMGREDLDKGAFRATLTAVWLVLGVALMCAFFVQGRVDAETLTRSALLFVPMVVGIGIGEVLHARVDEDRFRVGVWGLLAVASLSLLLK